jgi:hypothetical protein
MVTALKNHLVFLLLLMVGMVLVVLKMHFQKAPIPANNHPRIIFANFLCF